VTLPSFTNSFTNISISCWVNPTATNATTYSTIVGRRYAPNGGKSQFYIVLGGALGRGKVIFGGRFPAWKEIMSTYALTNGVWYHLCCTYDGSYLRTYINGLLNKDAAENGALYVGDLTLPIGIGCSGYVGSRIEALQGKVDELTFYNRALSLAEIQALYNGGSGFTW
jgi:hypothetical protein